MRHSSVTNLALVTITETTIIADLVWSLVLSNGKKWSVDDTVLALDLYKTPEVKHSRNAPKVQEDARLTKRSPDSIALKLCNFLAVETSGTKGCVHTARLDRQVWEEFDGRDHELHVEAERIRRILRGRWKEEHGRPSNHQ